MTDPNEKIPEKLMDVLYNIKESIKNSSDISEQQKDIVKDFFKENDVNNINKRRILVSAIYSTIWWTEINAQSMIEKIYWENTKISANTINDAWHAKYSSDTETIIPDSYELFYKPNIENSKFNFQVLVTKSEDWKNYMWQIRGFNVPDNFKKEFSGRINGESLKDISEKLEERLKKMEKSKWQLNNKWEKIDNEEVVIETSIEAERMRNIKLALEKWLKANWYSDIDYSDSFFDDKENNQISKENIDFMVSEINKLEKEQWVFFKNSIIESKISKNVVITLKQLEDLWEETFEDSIVDKAELDKFKVIFTNFIKKLLKNKDNLQTYTIWEDKASNKKWKWHKNSSDNIEYGKWHWNGQLNSDERRRIPKEEDTLIVDWIEDKDERQVKNERKNGNDKKEITINIWDILEGSSEKNFTKLDWTKFMESIKDMWREELVDLLKKVSWEDSYKIDNEIRKKIINNILKNLNSENILKEIKDYNFYSNIIDIDNSVIKQELNDRINKMWKEDILSSLDVNKIFIELLENKISTIFEEFSIEQKYQIYEVYWFENNSKIKEQFKGLSENERKQIIQIIKNEKFYYKPMWDETKEQIQQEEQKMRDEAVNRFKEYLI